MTVHWLHVYQRPPTGSAFIQRYASYGYKHRIVANGWFDTASCQLIVSRTESERMLGEYIGARCAFYTNNPAQPIWEGLINRVTVQYGGISVTSSMDTVINRSEVVYAVTTGAINYTAIAADTDSQGKYGIRNKTTRAWNTRGAPITPFEDMRDKIIATQNEPVASLIWRGGNTALVKIECVGFYHTLDWEAHQENAAAVTPSASIIEDLGVLLNGTTFIDNTDTSQIDTNAAFTTRGNDAKGGMSVWQQWLAWGESGDATNRWIVGVLPTDLSGNRVAYYRQANEDVEYTARQAEGMRVRNRFGALISPEYIAPDRRVKVTDILTGFAAAVIDPRQFYIMSVDYDAERKQVVLTGTDDITSEGTHMYKMASRPYDLRQGDRNNLRR